MKKVTRNIAIFFIALIFFLGLAPFFLNFANVQKVLTDYLSQNLDSSVTIKKMHWVWLPLPHLTLINTRLTGGHYDFNLPKVNIYPTWQVILGETRKPGKIILDSPRFHINKTAYQPRKQSKRSLPEVTLTINSGELEIESTEEFKDVLHADFLTFSDINGEVRLLPQEAKVDIRASSPFSKNITMQGSINVSDKNYRFSLDSQEIKLHKSIKALFKGRLIPVETPARLTGTVTGKGLQQAEGSLHGILPCFVVKPQDEQALLTCGFADLKFLKTGTLLRLDINDLEIKEPQLHLAGRIERKMVPVGSDEGPSTGEAAWSIDLSGRDLDLTAIRQKILTLWADNKIAQLVSGIVLKGKALSASYSFAGRTADFKRLDAMTIEADFINSDLHVPGAELDLTKASGQILIKNGTLAGHGLSARLGNSYGRNAELLLELGKKGKTFRLDIDLEADLADLPPVLEQLVKHEVFQRQLYQFQEVSGEATGTLHLGQTLDAITTRLAVDGMHFETRYAPIPEPVLVEGGTLQVEPGKVSWQGLKGSIGQQKIIDTSGNVSWQTGDPILHIESLQSELESASLLATLKQTGVIPLEMNNVLSSLNGTIEITRGSIQGPALVPGSWIYDFGLTGNGLTVSSPLLPEPANAAKIMAEINHEQVGIQESAIHFLDQTFNLQGLLKHHRLKNWHGMIKFDGPVQAKLASWISSKGWFPEKLHPQIPCTMDDLKVNWQGKTVAVSGKILHGMSGGRLPMAKIDFENSPEHLRVNELTFYTPGEQGRLTLDFWRFSPHRLVLTWEGFVSAASIDALFKHSPFSSGTFSGDFAINYLADQPGSSHFEGLLKADNLHLKTGSREKDLLIKWLTLQGIGKQLRIPALEMVIGSEKISGSGQLLAAKDGLQLDLSLASPFLSKNSLTILSQFMQESQNDFFHGHSDRNSEFQLPSGWDITGRIGFDFETFALDRQTSTPYDGLQNITYTFKDLHGDFQLTPDKISRTEVFSSKLCGLNFKSFWYSDESLGQKFQLFTNPDETLPLETVLPCLGVQQDIINGDFSLQANLRKESNRWYGGNIYIKSSQGRILRLKTLSRIFKVVNITDLFEEQLEYTNNSGFPFSQMDIDLHIDANDLILDRAIIHGEGLNLFARGAIHLDGYDADLTLLIAPFKTFDTIVAKVPIIGQPVTGADGSMVSIPVSIKGPLTNPAITPLHPEALGSAVLNLVKGTFMLPYNILNPAGQTETKSGSEKNNEMQPLPFKKPYDQ